MALIVNSIVPLDTLTDIPIDTTIVIEFDQPVDPHTIKKGISIYARTATLWSGAELSILDTNTRGVLDIGEEYTYSQYNFTVSGNIVTITPLVSLVAEKKYYIAIFPGSDASRYISSLTTSAPQYTRVGTSTGVIDIVSAYTGTSDSNFKIDFDGLGNMDITKGGADYIGQFPYISGEEIDIGELKISVTGIMDAGDSSIIDIFTSNGVSGIYRTSFITSKYVTFDPAFQSTKISTTQQGSASALKVVSTSPVDLSVNNSRCNPIVIRFNESIDITQNISNLITIKRKKIETGQVAQVGFYYKITDNILKLYLTTVE